MGSTNGNGVLYDNFLMKRFVGSKRAMVSMVNGRCGKRADNEAGWDDLISRGYSVIETDFPAELTEYIRKTETAATDLEKNIDIYYHLRNLSLQFSLIFDNKYQYIFRSKYLFNLRRMRC